VQIPAGTIELLTLALVIITAIYAYFNYLMAKRNGEMVAQMKAQHEAFLAPVIALAIKIKHGSMMCLLVNNRGQSPTNLRLSLDQDFHQFGKIGGRRQPAQLSNVSRDDTVILARRRAVYISGTGP
jgi:hypothetical protein